MLDTAELNSVEGDPIEGDYGIKSLLCLATSVHEDGTPIKTTDSLVVICQSVCSLRSRALRKEPPSLLFRSIMTLEMPEVDSRNVEIGGTYVCRIGNVYERCRVEKMDTGSYQIYLVDSAKFSEVPADDLFHIDAAFFGGDLDYGFVLRCSTPAPDYLEALKLPNLNQFRVNEVVEVIICSLLEPCLALLGSTTKHFSRIRAESIIQGMSGEDTQNWQIDFLDPEPSLSGVTSGQYPPAQPYLFEMFTLLTVVAFISLEKVSSETFVLSCIRLSFLQEIINDFYGADQCRQQMQFLDRADPLPDLPCVVFDEVSKQYLRAKILRLSGDRTIADVLAVDYPNVIQIAATVILTGSGASSIAAESAPSRRNVLRDRSPAWMFRFLSVQEKHNFLNRLMKNDKFDGSTEGQRLLT
uniref:Tudor domain-containing protein n=1 Tax=Ditylenchus dipsaci TaxID=166011 RepID=A0A915CL22_9BILA